MADLSLLHFSVSGTRKALKSWNWDVNSLIAKMNIRQQMEETPIEDELLAQVKDLIEKIDEQYQTTYVEKAFMATKEEGISLSLIRSRINWSISRRRESFCRLKLMVGLTHKEPEHLLRGLTELESICLKQKARGGRWEIHGKRARVNSGRISKRLGTRFNHGS